MRSVKAVKTLRHKITSHSKIFDETVEVYRKALTYIVDVMDREFPDLEGWNSKSIVSAVDRPIHATKKKPCPKY